MNRDLLTDLTRIRVDNRLTQATVARRMGVCRSSITRLETDRRRSPLLATLVRYAEAVGADIVVVDRRTS